MDDMNAIYFTAFVLAICLISFVPAR